MDRTFSQVLHDSNITKALSQAINNLQTDVEKISLELCSSTGKVIDTGHTVCHSTLRMADQAKSDHGAGHHRDAQHRQIGTPTLAAVYDFQQRVSWKNGAENNDETCCSSDMYGSPAEPGRIVKIETTPLPSSTLNQEQPKAQASPYQASVISSQLSSSLRTQPGQMVPDPATSKFTSNHTLGHGTPDTSYASGSSGSSTCSSSVSQTMCEIASEIKAVVQAAEAMQHCYHTRT